MGDLGTVSTRFGAGNIGDDVETDDGNKEDREDQEKE